MPTKKDKEQKGQGDRALIKDPLEWVVSHVEKKTRNLDKRKVVWYTLFIPRYFHRPD
jgi:hypothetical protein